VGQPDRAAGAALDDAAAHAAAEPELLVGAARRVDALSLPAAEPRVVVARARQVAGVQLEVHDGGGHQDTSSKAGTGRSAAGPAAARRPGGPGAATSTANANRA